MSHGPPRSADACLAAELILAGPHVALLRCRSHEKAPEEACGLLLGTRTEDRVVVEDVVCADNVAEDRTKHFRLAPVDWLKADLRARAEGWSIVAVWHSHPGGGATLSAADAAAAWSEYLQVIVVPKSPEEGIIAAFAAVDQSVRGVSWTVR